MKINRKYFEKYIVAQHDDEDYSESGYVVCWFPDQTCAIFNYSHCSCFGTWESISNHSDYSYDDSNPPEDREVTPVWEGTSTELIELARTKSDPAMPSRAACEEDSDYDHLMAVYDQILKQIPRYNSTQALENSGIKVSKEQAIVLSKLDKLILSADQERKDTKT